MRKKGYDYFDAFHRMSLLALQASQTLHAVMQNFACEQLPKQLEEMHEIEHEADDLRHDIMAHLVREFLPPLDHEDIVALSDLLDDVVDAVEDVLIGLYVYNVQVLRKDAIAYTDVMYQCCDALQTMMQELIGYQKSKLLKQSIEHLNSLEEKGDVLYSRTTRDLFTESLDAVEVIKWRSIFDRMEKCCDACEAVAHQVETIIMKNV